MPSTPGCQPALPHHHGPAAAEVAFLDLRQRLVQHLRLGLPALAVVAVQLPGDLLRGLAGVGGEHLHHLERGVHAPGGVDPRPELKGHGPRLHRAGRHSRHLPQGHDAGTHGTPQLHQAAARQHPVGAAQRHHVGDGAQGHDVQVTADVGHRVGLEPARFAEVRPQADDEVEGQPGRAKALVRKGAVGPLWIDDRRRRVRQPLRQLVVVDDDDIHAQGAGQRHLLGVGDAAVHGDDEGHVAGMEMLDPLAAHAVALADPVRDVEDRLAADLPQERHQGRRRRWCRPRRSRPTRRPVLHRAARG